MAYNKGVALNQREERENAGMLIYWQEDIDTHLFILLSINKMFIMYKACA